MCGDFHLENLTDNTLDWDSIYSDIAKQLLENNDFYSDDLYNFTIEQLSKALSEGLKIDSTNSDKNDLFLALQKNIYKFSAAKTATQMQLYKEAMVDDKGVIRSFDSFKKVIADQGEVFNNAYLKTEFNYTKQAAIMAHKWDTLDSEYLEFTTVGDNRVRAEHAIFDKFTALKSDPIWKRLYTPLAWGCRCTIIPGIEKNLSKEYDSVWADKTVNPLVSGTIFDNNVGISKVIFNKSHPYFNENNDKKIKQKEDPNVETTKVDPAIRKAKDVEIKGWINTNIPVDGLYIKNANFVTGEVYIPRSAIKSVADHFTSPELKEVAKHIVSNINNCKHIDSAPLNPNSHNYLKKKNAGVTMFHYYEFHWNNQKFRLNTEEIHGKIDKVYSANLIIKK